MCPCKFNLIGNLSSIIWLFALATSVYTDVFWEVQGFTSCSLILLSRTTSRTLLLFSFISLLFRIHAFHTFLIPHSASVTLFIWLLDNNNYYFLLARIQRIKKSTSAEHYRWKKKTRTKILLYCKLIVIPSRSAKYSNKPFSIVLKTCIFIPSKQFAGLHAMYSVWMLKCVV